MNETPIISPNAREIAGVMAGHAVTFTLEYVNYLRAMSHESPMSETDYKQAVEECERLGADKIKLIVLGSNRRANHQL